MNTQRISDRRMVVRGALTALFCGCWLLAGGAAAQEATPRAAPATAPAKRVPPSRKPRREKVGLPTIYYLKHADAASIAQTLAKVAEARELDARFVAETRLNAIIVQASPEVHEQVEQLIKVLDVAAVSPGDQKDAKQELHLEVYPLKYADGNSLLQALSAVSIDEGTRLAIDPKGNCIVVLASPETHQRVARLIEQLDVPQTRDVSRKDQFRIFSLVNAEARDLAEVITTFLGPDEKIAVDERTNSILVEAPQGTLLFIDAILTRLDETADKNLKRYGPEATFRLRVVWLANGLSNDDAAEPSDDLKGVLGELSKVGVKGLRQVGQVLVNTTPDGRFQVRCSPILDQRPSDLEISGEFDEQQETPTLKIELSASQMELPPATADGVPRRRSPERKPLVDLQTVIAAPLGHYVVLGVAPVEKMTSVFIVQVTAGK